MSNIFCVRCATIPEQIEAVLIFNGKSLCYEHFKLEVDEGRNQGVDEV